MHTGNVMVAGLSPNRQYLKSLMSFRDITMREDDGIFVQYGTRGDVGRTLIGERFLEDTQFDSLLLCDLDQLFPRDTLERLRHHNVDMVSGHYMKRSTKMLHSIWQHTRDGEWPYLPYISPNIPETGIHRIANTGMGCVLIKREVYEAVHEFMPLGSEPFEIGKVPELSPMAGNFGSDYRFFYYAQKLGFELWGDADIECPHYASLALTRKSYRAFNPDPEKIGEYLMENVFVNTIRSTGMISLNAVTARITTLELALDTIDDPDAKLITQGQLEEVTMWRNLLEEESPPPERVRAWLDKKPKDEVTLPTFKNDAVMADAIANRENATEGLTPEETVTRREGARKNQAVNAANRLNGKQKLITPINTSTNQGDLEEIT